MDEGTLMAAPWEHSPIFDTVEVVSVVRQMVQIKWTATYGECCKALREFIAETLVPLGAPDDVRIVFGFDS